MHSRFVAAAAALASLACPAVAQNLLTNPSFEFGLTGWNNARPNAAITVSYGSPDTPEAAVANHIQGAGNLLRDAGSSLVEQVVDLAGVPVGMNLRVGGFVGGTNNDSARLVTRFLDGAGGEIQRVNFDWVHDETRNFEPVLVRRERILPIPPLAIEAVIAVEFLDNCCGSAFAAADAIYAEPTVESAVPSARPLDTQLLINGDFESGWSAGSPLTLDDPRGWLGIANHPAVVCQYSDTNPLVPSTIVSCLIGGGQPSTSCVPGGAGNLLCDAGNGAMLRQTIDVRGNANSFNGGISLQVSGFFGGYGTADDRTWVQVQFLDATKSPIAPLPAVGDISRAARNSETVILHRDAEFLVPATTRYVQVDLVFSDVCCGASHGLVDNLDVRLTHTTVPAPVALNTNLIANPSFESGSLPGSPLQLTNADGWEGVQASAVSIEAYGTGQMPTSSFAATEGLGGQVLRDFGGGAILRQEIDLSADQALIAAGRYFVHTAAWLGGIGSIDDTAELRVRFLNFAGVQVGGAAGLQVLGPVTAADRADVTTLLRRDATFPIPAGATRMQVDVHFTDVCCGAAHGLADDVLVMVFDSLVGGPSLYHGTGDDLRLFSGVNAAPTTGPGHDWEDAVPGDVLNLRVASPDGAFDSTPFLLGASPFPTGNPPITGVPGFWLDPAGIVRLADGVFCGGFGCPVILPGGTNYNLQIPAGLTNVSIMLQALTFALPGSATPANGVFAATDAHEIRIP